MQACVREWLCEMDHFCRGVGEQRKAFDSLSDRGRRQRIYTGFSRDPLPGAVDGLPSARRDGGAMGRVGQQGGTVGAVRISSALQVCLGRHTRNCRGAAFAGGIRSCSRQRVARHPGHRGRASAQPDAGAKAAVAPESARAGAGAAGKFAAASPAAACVAAGAATERPNGITNEMGRRRGKCQGTAHAAANFMPASAGAVLLAVATRASACQRGERGLCSPGLCAEVCGGV
mmetsp:Transcript_60573/g.169187  ORF Transcript_60573/g.169187 Transcript_60573/m.169187 type:complete len:231 (+) Transcript_60573:856-1548(+)